MRWAIGVTCPVCQLARLRPTIRQIVIVVIIIVIGEAKLEFHNGGIIAQTCLSSAVSCGLTGL
jgi:hypothetical protein